ncbi:response regulator transcription factor [Colwellia sp. MB3u-70]|uniref:response regulator transcription factor n=1 Tax=unclassified Colwellia TaxID=196834 RepID=UPI0015F651F1|nr:MULTISPECIES: response regulator transcription factor [unclassified Colwellia]MBA6292945.1 response regulator transcription factor [Colwellia sp. MB3u-8]MBA6306526.1 response regulator transcription factor [Colwellia sp. MB3u-70]
MLTHTKILVVDDDELTRQVLSSYFENEGYNVLCATTAEEAEEVLALGAVDLILLDIRMPGKDGLTLTRELRVNSETGIILVTGSQDEVDRIIGLECGADEYVTKPFNPREILARAKNLIRRVKLCQQAKLEVTGDYILKAFDRWKLNPVRRQLIDEQKIIVQLTEGEFQLLKCLMDHVGKIMSRDQILDQIRSREWVSTDRTVDVLIGRLRRKLGDDSAAPRLILTVHGAGYLFTPKLVNVV